MSESWAKSKPLIGKFKIPIIILIILVLGGLILYISKNNKTPVTTNKITCAQEYTKQCALTDAVPLLDGTKQSQFKDITEKIKTIPSYTKDVDLMYVVTTYYYNQGDLSNTQNSYNLLLADYKPSVGYTALLKNKAITPTQMADKIVYLKQTLGQKPTLFGAPSNE